MPYLAKQPHMTRMQRGFRATQACLFLLNQAAELEGLLAWVDMKQRGRAAKHFYFIGRQYETRYGTVCGKTALIRRRHPPPRSRP